MRAGMLWTLLAFSILLNAFLWRAGKGHAGSAPADPGPGEARAVHGVETIATQANPEHWVPDAAVAYFSHWTWHPEQDPELDELVRHLRSLGLPDTLIRGMVVTLAREWLQNRTARLFGGEPSVHATQGQMRAQSQLRLEMQAMIDQAMGGRTVGMTDAEGEELRRRYGKVPPDKLLEIETIAARQYWAWDTESSSPAEGFRRRMLAMERDFLEEIRPLLTDEEWDSYALHATVSGSEVRRELGDLDVTPQELSKLLKWQRNLTSASIARDPDFGALEVEMMRSRRELLGDERFHEMAGRSATYFPGLQRILPQTMPPSAQLDFWFEIVDLGKAHSELWGQYRARPEDRDRVMSAFAGEVEERLTAIGGEEAWNRYRNSPTGRLFFIHEEVDNPRLQGWFNREGAHAPRSSTAPDDEP
ncbi:MAG: hypothetical protein EA425_07620 [Puniceicoccaceae bacterium]|nr:MAG: hypothetical protein EA425_07620 [Puniceicoccaceae bacterium]